MVHHKSLCKRTVAFLNGIQYSQMFLLSANSFLFIADNISFSHGNVDVFHIPQQTHKVIISCSPVYANVKTAHHKM